MELHIPLSLIIFFLTFFYLFTKIKTSTSPHTNSNYNLPPQPWKLPLIGHLHHLLGSLPHIALKLSPKPWPNHSPTPRRIHFRHNLLT
ncbi:putative oxidoreductase [Helianthus anomalus]